MRYVAVSMVTDTQIHTHRTTTVTLAHALRIKNARYMLYYVNDKAMYAVAHLLLSVEN